MDSPETIMNMQHIFEELVMQSLIPSSSSELNLIFTAEYSESDATVEIRLRYNGPNFNIIDNCDPSLAFNQGANHAAKQAGS